jgi:hypothetical protein
VQSLYILETGPYLRKTVAQHFSSPTPCQQFIWEVGTSPPQKATSNPRVYCECPSVENRLYKGSTATLKVVSAANSPVDLLRTKGSRRCGCKNWRRHGSECRIAHCGRTSRCNQGSHRDQRAGHTSTANGLPCPSSKLVSVRSFAMPFSPYLLQVLTGKRHVNPRSIL